MSDLLRVYLDPSEIGLDGYPYAWASEEREKETVEHVVGTVNLIRVTDGLLIRPAIKDLVREQAGHRCERCGHPYIKGNPRNSARSEWTPCDEHCTHRGPARIEHPHGDHFDPFSLRDTDVLYEGTCGELIAINGQQTEAQWRILTVHHLNGIKHDCTWGNLVALCQRCHLCVQGNVVMDRAYDRPHSAWFRPYAAFHYARKYLGEELSREEVEARIDDLLSLELRQERIPGV